MKFVSDISLDEDDFVKKYLNLFVNAPEAERYLRVRHQWMKTRDSMRQRELYLLMCEAHEQVQVQPPQEPQVLTNTIAAPAAAATIINQPTGSSNKAVGQKPTQPSLF